MQFCFLFCFQVNNNGDITFNAAYSGYSPTAFPISGNPMIAPFFSDIDTNGAGSVWYRTTTDASLLAKAVGDVPSILTGPNFTPVWLFIATWDHVGYYSSHSDKVSIPTILGIPVCSTPFCLSNYAWSTNTNSLRINQQMHSHQTSIRQVQTATVVPYPDHKT